MTGEGCALPGRTLAAMRLSSDAAAAMAALWPERRAIYRKPIAWFVHGIRKLAGERPAAGTRHEFTNKVRS